MEEGTGLEVSHLSLASQGRAAAGGRHDSESEARGAEGNPMTPRNSRRGPLDD